MRSHRVGVELSCVYSQGRFGVLLCFNITNALCDVIEIFL